MAPTTDPSDNVAAQAVIAEQAAVEKLLNDANNSIEEAISPLSPRLSPPKQQFEPTSTEANPTMESAMDLDHEPVASMTAAANPVPMSIDPTTQAPALQAQVQAPIPNIPTPTVAAALTPSRVGTPSGSIHPNGNGISSRAASVQAESTHAVPTIAREHGAPARQYLNEKVTPHLLEIMKKIGVEQPENPIRALAEFLDQRATELGQ